MLYVHVDAKRHIKVAYAGFICTYICWKSQRKVSNAGIENTYRYWNILVSHAAVVVEIKFDRLTNDRKTSRYGLVIALYILFASIMSHYHKYPITNQKLSFKHSPISLCMHRSLTTHTISNNQSDAFFQTFPHFIMCA